MTHNLINKDEEKEEEIMVPVSWLGRFVDTRKVDLYPWYI